MIGLTKLAFKSLKADFLKSCFYFLTFLLTTIFIFSFFNLTFNPSTGINLGKDDNTFVTPIAVFVIIIAMMCVFLANNFYVSNKSKDISITLMSGASVFQVGYYLFVQSFVVMILAIPLGYLLGYLLIPVINQIFASSFVYQGELFYLSDQTIIATSMILFFEVLWCTVLNMGYCYRSTISDIKGSDIKIEDYGLNLKGKALNDKVYIVLYILPLIAFVFMSDTFGFLLISIFGVVGVLGLIKQVIPNYIKKQQRDSSLENPVQIIGYGYFEYDIQKVFSLLVIILLASILLSCIIIYDLKNPLVSMIALVSYLSVMVLMSLTIVFKIGMELNNRKRAFMNLNFVGYLIDQLKQIVKKEMTMFYGLILLLPMIYQLVMLSKLVIINTITLNLALIILAIQVVPIIISLLITIKLYYNILPKKN